eukprot:2360863-Lingulodinium_polyedra.AAC.1
MKSLKTPTRHNLHNRLGNAESENTDRCIEESENTDRAQSPQSLSNEKSGITDRARSPESFVH